MLIVIKTANLMKVLEIYCLKKRYSNASNHSIIIGGNVNLALKCMLILLSKEAFEILSTPAFIYE